MSGPRVLGSMEGVEQMKTHWHWRCFGRPPGAIHPGPLHSMHSMQV